MTGRDPTGVSVEESALYLAPIVVVLLGPDADIPSGSGNKKS